jgi:C_GCAxxG_C_C family probable redox protein
MAEKAQPQGQTGAPDPVARATQLFAAGISCAPAILGAFAPRLGIDEEHAARCASCFGGGMISSGKTCGAVTGAMMVIGLARGPGVRADADARKDAYDLTAELWRRFTARHGSIECREILGVDISTPEGRAEAVAANLFTTRCADAVRDAAEIVRDLL